MFFIFQSNEIRFETFQNENDKKAFSMHYERHFLNGVNKKELFLTQVKIVLK